MRKYYSSITVVLALSLCIFVFTLPPFYSGLGGQGASTVLAYRIITAILSLLLLLYSYQSPRCAKRLKKHTSSPASLTLLALALWTTLTSLFHQVPIRNLLGSPELGEGAILFYSLWVTYLAAALIYPIKQSRHIIYITAIASVIVMVLMQHNYAINRGKKEEIWVPYFFSDYLGFFHVYIIGFALFWANAKKHAHHMIGIALLVLAIMYVSKNDTSNLLLICSTLWAFLSYKIYTLRKYWRTWCTFHVLAIPLTIILLIVILGSRAQHNEKFYTKGQLQTLVSRYNMIPITFEAMIDNPSSWIAGNGWGSYSDQHISYLETGKLDLLNNDGPRWEGTWRHHFHTHNQPLEYFYSGGLPSLLLYILLFALPCIYGKKHPVFTAIFAFTLIGLSSQWFNTTLHYPFFMTVLAGMLARQSFNIRYIPTSLVSACLVLACLFNVWGSYALWSINRQYNAFWHSYNDETKQALFCKPSLLNDQGRGGLHLSKLLRGYSGYLVTQTMDTDVDKDNPPLKDPSTFKLEEDSYHRLEHIMCLTDHYTTNHASSTQLKFTQLLVQSDIALSLAPYLPYDVVEKLLQDWEQNIINFTNQHTKRTDQAIPYMLWHLNQGQEGKVLDMAEHILNIKPNAPEGNWFKGIVMLGGTPNTIGKGVELMKQALQNNLELVMPIDNAIKEELFKHAK